MDNTPTPGDPAPVDPTPVEPTPVEPTPGDPAPVDPTPVEPTPVEPPPVAPPPVAPPPVAPPPVAPTPVAPPPYAQPPYAQPPYAQPPYPPPPYAQPPYAQPPYPPPPYAPPQYAPPPYAPPPYAPAYGEYPVQLNITVTQPELNRLWGIPYFGILVRVLLAIPHLVALLVLGIGVFVVVLLGWIPILLTGRVPGMQAAWVKEFIHRSSRVSAYAYLFPGGYPPLEPGAPNPLDLTIDLEGRSMNRLWGIPIVGFYARMIALIPHLIVLGILSLVGSLAMIVLWIPILINGKYPSWAMSLYSGLLRYSARVEAYLLLLPVPYPPFSLS